MEMLILSGYNYYRGKPIYWRKLIIGVPAIIIQQQDTLERELSK
jgi:hypothetical protein